MSEQIFLEYLSKVYQQTVKEEEESREILEKLKEFLAKRPENYTAPVQKYYSRYYVGNSDIILISTQGGKLKPKFLTRRKWFCRVGSSSVFHLGFDKCQQLQETFQTMQYK